MTPFNDRLRVAALPLDIKLTDKESNLRAVENAFTHLPAGVDIVVLPELFSTGYTDDEAAMRQVAERNTESTIDRLKALATKYSTAIAGSFAALTPPHIYNRAFFIEPSGDEYFYDKRHLFSVSTESNVFTAGDRPSPEIRFRGWNIALAVCYDIRFPVWCRNRYNACDLMLVCANWPQVRAYAWEHLLIARAIENQYCIVGANRGGSDRYGTYDGLTFVFDHRGCNVGFPAGSFIFAELSKAKLEQHRTGFPVANDADDFEILR